MPTSALEHDDARVVVPRAPSEWSATDPVDPNDPMRPLASVRRVYIVPELRLMYMSLAKNACTSIKWLMAELAGEDLEGLAPALGNHPNREAGVHNRTAWKRARRLEDLGESGRREIHADHGWMVFGVVRDPRLRLFSAWQSKFLLRNPKYAAHGDRAWAPRIPTAADHVVADFAAFVEAMREGREQMVPATDTHFRSQVSLLAEHLVPYTHLYDVCELDTLLDDLGAHVRGHGWGGEVGLGTSNDTPLRAHGAVFAGGVKEAIEEIYADDFARFGDRWDFSGVQARTAAWSEESIGHVRSLVETHRRITDLAAAARELKRDKDRLTARVERLERQLATGPPDPSRPGVLSRLRRLSSR